MLRPLVLAALCLLPRAALAQDEPLRELRAVKLTNVDSDVLFSDAAIAEAMDTLAALGINAVLPVVWNSSGADGTHTLYPSAVMDSVLGRRIHPRFAGRDVLQRVIVEAHRNGIEVLPWFEMGFSPSYSQSGGYILAQKPEWTARDVSGEAVVKNGFDWMAATNPEVQNLLHDLAVEVVQRYDTDGVEYSDRIPAMPVEAGYDEATRALYREEHGGAEPPGNHKDAAWMRWRADKLTGFFQRVRESVKSEGTNLTVAASPSLYPWAYQNYLQDSKTWIEDGVADHVIPQVYRYNFSDYAFELDKSLRNYPGAVDRYFSGMLVRLGSYTIADDYFRRAIEANRERGVMGEVFFFYEGLRAEGGRLKDVLREVYAQPALVPGREGVWRSKAMVASDESAVAEGAWEEREGGYQGRGYRASTSAEAAAAYAFDVPASAWYGVYAHGTPIAGAATAARYTVTGRDASETVMRDQTDPALAGWHRLATVYLEAGEREVVRLGRAAPSAAPLLADDVMLMIDRKRSPGVVIPTSRETASPASPGETLAAEAYPNPFARETTLRFPTYPGERARIAVYDVLGRRVSARITQRGDGEFAVALPHAAPGLYLARITTPTQTTTVRLYLRPS
jgi:uncharacterized lipoprotein YddW (UPF0748 family)